MIVFASQVQEPLLVAGHRLGPKWLRRRPRVSPARNQAAACLWSGNCERCCNRGLRQNRGRTVYFAPHAQN
eukprot:6895164-Pyramimonas_sp.AAC.1